jgi:Domain of unknown function (DUF5655)
MTLDDYFATGPAHERPVFEAVMAHLEVVGPVHVEPVAVGILLKSPRTFAELRPMRRWVAVSFTLRRVVHHRLIARRPIANHGGRVYHVANVARPDDLDDELLGWLVEAYLDG